MIYPLLSEYMDAVRDAADNFESLSYLRPVLGADGNPYMSSGNFAVVFKMRDERDGCLYAVKCFTKDQEGREDAYDQISAALAYVESPYLTSIRYLDSELFVDTQQSDETEFAVVLMDWVEGVPLDKYVHSHEADAHALGVLCYRFSQLALWLNSQPFAHGDLKPDNILVRADGTLVLVDYDGMYVPAMCGSEARELGSPDYVHPLRTKRDFNASIDDFALSVIALSLKAISLDASLLQEGKKKDVLLLTRGDFQDLGSSTLFARLMKLSYNTEFNNLLGLFLIAHSRGSFASLASYLFVPEPPQLLKKASGPYISSFYEMIRVDGGSFQGERDYPVTLDTFWIGKYPVTQAQWEEVMGDNPSCFKGDEQRPVECVTWYDCVNFCNALSRKEGLQECYEINGTDVNLNLNANGYRLPTEAEWEFAARGGNQSKGYAYSGSNDLDQVGWYKGNSNNTTYAVGQKQANELGLYDMSGNVWEWCWDWYDDDYYAKSPTQNPLGPATGSYRVLRGGCYCNDAGSCRVASRNRGNPDVRIDNRGVRLVRRP